MQCDDARDAGAPGLQYVGGRRWLVEGSLAFPLLDEPKGIQLATRWNARLGLRVLIL